MGGPAGSLGRAAIHQGHPDGHQHDGGRLDRQLHRPGKEEAADQAAVPGDGARRLERPIDEAGRCPNRTDRAHQRDGVAEAL